MSKVSILVTAIGRQSNVSTTFFESPKICTINPFKIWASVPTKKGTEIYDESGKNVLIVRETPEEINKLANEE